MQYAAEKKANISNPASSFVRCKRSDRFRSFGELSPYMIPERMIPTYRDRSNVLLMGVTVARKTLESTIAIEHKLR
jgi:hypothetical protein